MRGIGSLMLGSVVLAAALIWWLSTGEGTTAGTGRGYSLTVHCAAGIKGPVTEVANEYENRFGTRIHLTLGGSGTLLSALTVRAHGDIYIAGDDSYVDTAKERGLVDEVLAIATMRPVLAVRRGNPKHVAGFRDLLRPEIRVGLGNPSAAAIGAIAERTATDLGIWQELEAKAAVFKPTVNDLGNDLLIGTIDAAVIWDATTRQYQDFEIVADADLARHERRVTLGIVRDCSQPGAALHFARYLTARDRGLRTFEKHGFTPVDGDSWADVPRLELMSGAMLRPAIEATLDAFEKREGVVIDRIYNGCGILVSQMKTGKLPDAYFSCDATFLDAVQSEFHDGVTISSNDIVMLLPRDNPKHIAQLGDLLRPGVRVGLGHPEKSALGALTVGLLARTGHGEALAASGNVAVESATGDLLVNQILTGSLDAVLVYRSNAAHVLDRCQTIPVEDAAARATQPYAIAKNSKHPILMQRLLDAIRSATSQARFQGLGFGWGRQR